MDPFLGWLPSLLMAWKIFYAPWVSLASSVLLPRLQHCPLRGCLQESLSCHTLLGLLGLHLKSGWKTPWPHNSCILTCQGLTPSSEVAMPSWTMAVVICECQDCWVWENNSLGGPVLSWHQEFSSPRKLFQMSLNLYNLMSVMEGVWAIPETSSWHLSSYHNEKPWLFFSGLILFSNHTLLGPTFAQIFSLPNSMFSKPFCSNLCLHINLA
jgi:hypothetical protein